MVRQGRFREDLFFRLNVFPITFDVEALGFQTLRNGACELKLDTIITRHITAVLHMAGGRIEGKDGAAEYLGLNPRTLRSRLEKLGIPFGRNTRSLYKICGPRVSQTEFR